ncbi:putative dynamin-related protein 4A [Capsicum chinense]|nr:putative dynamin-related protein 4A [Capsicum chinense]
MESEFIALDKTGEEKEWLWNFLEDIPYWPNQWHQELLSSGIITVDYVKSKDNVSDLLTKGLSREGVEKISKGMGLRPRASQHGDSKIVFRNSAVLKRRDATLQRNDTLTHEMFSRIPKGQGICTRVPLIMRLQNDPQFSTAPHLCLKYNGKSVDVDEVGVADVIILATDEIAGHATVDFPTCESIRMSQKVDKIGERTLAVVTKADKAPEGLLEKVTADEVNIGLGYICVRNRIGKESYEAARKNEAGLFENHPLLSKIGKSMVGIPVLAQKLVCIHATIISKPLPDIERKINDKLSTNLAELNRLPQHLNSMAEALSTFMRILSSFKDSLKKILLRGEFDEYPEESEMHCSTRLVEMLHQFSDELHAKNFDGKEDSLMEEITALEETNWIGLPNFLPRYLFLNVLQKRVKEVAAVPEDFVGRVWNYRGRIVMKVLMHHCGQPKGQKCNMLQMVTSSCKI